MHLILINLLPFIYFFFISVTLSFLYRPTFDSLHFHSFFLSFLPSLCMCSFFLSVCSSFSLCVGWGVGVCFLFPTYTQRNNLPDNYALVVPSKSKNHFYECMCTCVHTCMTSSSSKSSIGLSCGLELPRPAQTHQQSNLESSWMLNKKFL